MLLVSTLMINSVFERKSMRINKLSKLFVVLIMVFAIFAPDFASARAGGGGSFGSSGSRSFSSPSSARPFQRTTATPQSSPNSPPFGANPMVNPMSSHPFLSGIAGGILGAGIGHLLFGGGMGGMGGGGLLPILLIGGLIYMGYRYFRSQNIGGNTGGNIGQGGSNVFTMNSFASSNSAPQQADVTQNISVCDDDIASFKQLLIDVQHAWSEGNINHLRQYVTPEMLNYFSDELSANSSRGLANKVEQVEVTRADIVDSWQEYNLNYARVIMQWSALDYMVRLDREPVDADFVASGDHKTPETAQEQWTFSRVQGGRWVLSAIQQL